VQLVDQAGFEVLADRRDPAADADVAAAGGGGRLLQRGADAARDEAELRPPAIASAAHAWCVSTKRAEMELRPFSSPVRFPPLRPFSSPSAFLPRRPGTERGLAPQKMNPNERAAAGT
jgi:hypothetical protein